MKIEIKLGLNQSSITFLFFSGFLLGAVITGVALLGSQVPLKCFEAGNAADWLAAAGTWVIGIAAGWVAYTAHKRNEQELDSANKRRQNEVISLRALAATELTNAYCLVSPLAAFIADDASGRTMKSIRRLIAQINRDAQAVRIESNVMAAIPMEGVMSIKSINNNLEYIRDLAEALSNSFKSRAKSHDDDLSSDVDLHIIETMKKYADEIEAACLAFFELADHP
jgi:hypothetical protein